MIFERPEMLTRDQLTKAAKTGTAIALEDRAAAFAGDPSMAIFPSEPMGYHALEP